MSWTASPPKRKQTALSPATAAFLQEQLQQRPLSHRAHKDVHDSIASGTSNWVEALSSGCATTYQPPRSKSACPVKAPKVGLGPAAAPLPAAPQRACRKRLADIQRDGALEREVYVGGAPVVDREAEKERYALQVQYGKQRAAELEHLVAARAATSGTGKQARHGTAKSPRARGTKEALIDTIVDEIRDRREHLEALEGLGPVSDPVKRGLLNDIGQRLSELRTLGVAAGPPQC